MISIEGLWKSFRLYKGRTQTIKGRLVNRARDNYDEFWALRDVSLSAAAGESIGIIGANGCGKSTLLKCLTGIYRPTRGRLSVDGRVSALIELGAGFHPELSGRENVFLNASILGLDQREIRRRFDDIVDFSGIGGFIDSPVKVYSSGMTVRLGFAVAANVDPDVLLVDEVLAVGDEEFQQRCFERLARFRRDGGTIVLVSHALDQVRQVCDRAIWIHHGGVEVCGTPSEAIDAYLHEVHDAKVDQDGSARWGTGEVRFERVEVVSADGAASTGGPLSIRVEVRPHSPVDGLIFGLRIDGPDGSPLWSTNTALQGFPLPVFTEPTMIEFVIPSLPLLNGSYQLTCSLADGSDGDVTTSHRYDHWEHCATIDVVSGASGDLHTMRIPGAFSVGSA